MRGEIKTFLGLFAGAGGLSEGFIREGFQPVAFIEKEKDACPTFPQLSIDDFHFLSFFFFFLF